MNGDYYHNINVLDRVLLVKPKPTKMINKINRIVIIISVVLLVSCKDSNQYTTINPSETTSKKSNQTHKVIAKETINAGMYTYAKVSENDREFWIAIPETEIEIGQTYYYDNGTKMVNFKSKELNKTFEEVFFVEALRGHAAKAPKINSVELISQPENGIAIMDILENANAFSKKEVIVKGKVVKVNKNILDRNWVHLRDGTSFNGKYNLTFTTQDSVKLGDIVTFKGVVTLNKDFGHGYIYPILIEKGELIK